METDIIASLLTPSTAQLLIAALLGMLIGLEREVAGKDPSIRTFSLIATGSCLFAILSLEVFHEYHVGDPTRIAAQIIPGIGFLGAGTIFRSKYGVSGFTTAALMWMTAGIGMAVGLGRLDLGFTATVIALFITLFLRLVHNTVRKFRKEPYDHGRETQ
jgi:putative Mg2+ transporter-C (MgtC) family protein